MIYNHVRTLMRNYCGNTFIFTGVSSVITFHIAQGLRWYARRLKMDEDGDVADEFLDEVSPDTLRSVGAHKNPAPRFEVKNSTKPVKVRNLELLPNGKIHHLVEHHGKLEWL